jgi:surface antigen
MNRRPKSELLLVIANNDSGLGSVVPARERIVVISTIAPRVSRQTALLLAFLTVLLTAGVVTVGTQPAFADTTICTGNDWTTCPGAGYTEHEYGAHQGTSYWSAFTGHNCTNYAAYMASVVRNAPSTSTASGDAQYWDTTTSSGVIIDTVPIVGSIAQWEASANHPAGHVAYVESVNPDGSITVSEDNFSAGPFRWRNLTTSGDWPNRFIHFRDVPVPGDFNRDSYTDLATFRPSTHLWYGRKGLAGTSLFTGLDHGLTGDIPVPGDYDGDGYTDIAVFRPSTGYWYVRKAMEATSILNVQYGQSGDIPVPGDYDG